jgi:hypothetical protein
MINEKLRNSKYDKMIDLDRKLPRAYSIRNLKERLEGYMKILSALI